MLVLLLASFLSPLPAAALVEPFNPGAIISDDEFNNPFAMDCRDIQDFLGQRPGILKGYVVGDKSAARIICEQAYRFNLNPRLILTMLQKEQGLLTEAYPTQYAVDWAAGCAPGYEEARGLANQVECAARTLRNRFDTVTLGTTVDGVAPVNRATLALARYNEDQRGNNTFWQIWSHYWPQSDAVSVPTEYMVDAEMMETTPAVVDTCRSGWLKGDTGLKGLHLLTPNAAGVEDSTNAAVWRPTFLREGAYQVLVYIPDHPALEWPCKDVPLAVDTSHATYVVHHRDGETSYEVNQAPISNGWVNIGTYYFSKGTIGYVRLTDLTGEESMTRYVNFDTVKFVWIAP